MKGQIFTHSANVGKSRIRHSYVNQNKKQNPHYKMVLPSHTQEGLFLGSANLQNYPYIVCRKQNAADFVVS
jgi:3-deoxy-D-manno-octulosonic-acid transferase